MKTQGHSIDSSSRERRSKILKSKKGKNYKEESKEEIQEKNEDTYEIKVEETPEKCENSATKEEYEAEENGEDSDQVGHEFHEADIQIILGPNIKAPKVDRTVETQSKAQEIVTTKEESMVEKIIRDLEYYIKALNENVVSLNKKFNNATKCNETVVAISTIFRVQKEMMQKVIFGIVSS